MAADETSPSPELRALYEQFECAPTLEARQEIWNAIVAYQRSREVRVEHEAAVEREQLLAQHRRRRFWLF
ncbi:MAG TPA: hypothetical protein VFB73_07790 [Chloroflexota bacterium]|nr:hypothetical protein [Chloroflexota bacterium]